MKARIGGLLAAVVIASTGCGSAHTKIDTPAVNLDQYQSVYIHDVKVYSVERAAQGNLELQKKLKQWQQTARADLEKSVKSSQYTLVDTPTGGNGKTLVVDLDVNVTYGNQALRWAVGFGAGKGKVHSELAVADAQTRQIQFKGSADSELVIGGAGGDMGSVVHENTQKLITQLRISAKSQGAPKTGG